MINEYASKQKQKYRGINNQEKKLSKNMLGEKVSEKVCHRVETKRKEEIGKIIKDEMDVDLPASAIDKTHRTHFFKK